MSQVQILKNGAWTSLAAARAIRRGPGEYEVIVSSPVTINPREFDNAELKIAGFRSRSVFYERAGGTNGRGMMLQLAVLVDENG